MSVTCACNLEHNTRYIYIYIYFCVTRVPSSFWESVVSVSHAFRADSADPRIVSRSSQLPWYQGCSLNFLLASMAHPTSEVAGASLRHVQQHH